MLEPAVKKETKNVIIYTVIGFALMITVFLVCHLIWPDTVPFDYTVFLGAVCGSIITVLNFFLMALTVQKVASMDDRDAATKLMKNSYSRRLLIQCLWIVAVIFAPCFQLFAGILPLLFPSFGIKIYGLFRKDLKSEAKPASSKVPDETAEPVQSQPEQSDTPADGN